MLTTISKCLAVFTAVACLLFLGFAMISTAAGHNWTGDVEELREFTFTPTVSETGTTWKLESRVNGEFSPKNGMLPDMVVEAREQLKKEQDARIERLDTLIGEENARLTAARQLIETDLKAIETRLTRLDEELAGIRQQIQEKTDAAIKLADEISQVQVDTETRREEVIRLHSKLKEIRADKFRAAEQQKRLADLLVRVNGTIDRAERRNRLLNERLNKPYETKPDPMGAATALNSID